MTLICRPSFKSIEGDEEAIGDRFYLTLNSVQADLEVLSAPVLIDLISIRSDVLHKALLIM